MCVCATSAHTHTHDASQPHEDGHSRMKQYYSMIQGMFAAAIKSRASKHEAPHTQPDADRVKKEQMQERARGIFFQLRCLNSSSWNIFQQVGLESTCLG